MGKRREFSLATYFVFSDHQGHFTKQIGAFALQGVLHLMEAVFPVETCSV
jgi:hypothetical protein